MERNKYDLHREVLTHKYADILKSFEETHDDRRIAWNCYQQLIGACEAMRDSGMENSFACCAVNKAMQEQEAEIDGIVTRFTGKVYKGVRWVDVTETDIYSLSSTEIDYETEMRLCELDAEIAAHFLSGDADKQAACERELDCILGGIEICWPPALRPGGMSRWASSWWERPAAPGPGLTTAPAMPGRKSLEPRPSAWNG